jgi:hypothetical protein
MACRPVEEDVASGGRKNHLRLERMARLGRLGPGFPHFSKNGPTRRSKRGIRDVFQSKHAALLVGWENHLRTERTALSKLLILSNMHRCVRLEEWSFLSTITFFGVVESFVKVSSLE